MSHGKGLRAAEFVRDFDLNLLRYLPILVEEPGVTRAAERLGVTQPAVSAALKRLRMLFDDPILVRVGQAMTATPRASELAARVTRILDAARELTQQAELFDAERSNRTFTLCGSDYVEFFIAPSLHGRLRHRAPHVCLRHQPANTRLASELMHAGEVDLGIGQLVNPPPSLRARLLFKESLVCVVRREHPVLAEPWTLDRYNGLRHVAVSPGGRGVYDGHVDTALKTRGLKRRVDLVLSSFLAAPATVCNTDLVATLPARLAHHHVTSLPLAILPLPLETPALEISMYWHERVHADPANAWLRGEVVRLREGNE